MRKSLIILSSGQLPTAKDLQQTKIEVSYSCRPNTKTHLQVTQENPINYDTPIA